MKNLACHNPTEADHNRVDTQCRSELEFAGIPVRTLELIRKNEVPTNVYGELGPWSFERGWYYWFAQGPGIPPSYTKGLHTAHGQDCRVAGHCGAPDPVEWFKGFGCGLYHVDTQEALNALADTIRKVMSDALEGTSVQEAVE